MISSKTYKSLNSSEELADYLRKYNFISDKAKAIPPFFFCQKEEEPRICTILGYEECFPTWSTAVIDFGEGPFFIHCDMLKEMQKGLSDLKKEYASYEIPITSAPAADASYILFDIETTGYYPDRDRIIEISAVRIRDGRVEETFTSLVQPGCTLKQDIIKLTGITDEMLAAAPAAKEVLPGFLQFIGDSRIMGHNIDSFDIPFINKALADMGEGPLVNKTFDTLKFSRETLENLKSHSLEKLAWHFQISYEGAHRSLQDCYINFAVYEKLCEIAKDPKKLASYKKKSGNENKPAAKKSDYFKTRFNAVKAKDIVAATEEFDESHPLFGKVCVITGNLQKQSREEAMQAIADAGGINADNITRKTNLLILGANDPGKTGKSGKQKKAEEYIEKGCPIEIISEEEFNEKL